MKRPTIQDIARKAGVGAGTVSRVLNNQPYVKEATRQRVLDAMAELDYRPSFSARHMRTQRSRLIGFVTDEVATSPYAGDILLGAQEAAWEKDYILLVVSAGSSIHRVAQAVETFLERGVEGIIFAAMWHHAVDLPANITQAPIVLANCFVEDRSLPSVVPDEALGGYRATEVLLEKGHRRIGFIDLNPGPASEGRLSGYRRALADFTVEYDPALIRDGNGESQLGYQRGRELMALDNPPTAIFCSTDRTAMGVYDALKEQGLRIPADVAIVGFDNQTNFASALHPSLSTMQLPHYEMGQWALNYLLLEQADTLPPNPIQEKLDCPFVSRNSA
jgi:LacI family transcriptional regulator